jgi:beta-glucosidase/6-phospho-beta-glucosidase/beta-galactosidase
MSYRRLIGHGGISEEGLQYYRDLVDQIISQGMKPVATLFHWDLPLLLEIRYGGFTSDKIVDDFANYAALMFKELNDRGVRMWFTFNEPQVFCHQRYPLVQAHVHGQAEADPWVRWSCAGHLLMSHGKAVEIFREMKNSGKISKNAKISYKNAGSYNVPWRKHNSQDKEALKRDVGFFLGLFADPIYKTDGDYSAMVKDEVPKEWLPELSSEDKARIKGSADFFATDFYASGISKATERDGGLDKCIRNTTHPAWPSCTDWTTTMPDGQLLGEKSDETTEGWLMNTAGTLRRHLKYVYDQYKSHEIYIAEIGWAERGQAGKTEVADMIRDGGREKYLLEHLAEMLLAIYNDGVPLKGVFFWVSISSQRRRKNT